MKSYGFSSVVKEWLKNANTEITQRAIKTEINKVLQVANRRIQNIENAKIASPAYKALMNELTDSAKNRFSKFSIGGLDLTNFSQRQKAIDTYSRALSYINNSTSSASGARKWIKNLANENKIPFDVANNLVDLITSPQITNGQIVVNNWDSERVSGLVSEYSNNYNETVENKETFYNIVEQKINDLMNKAQNDNFDIFDL